MSAQIWIKTYALTGETIRLEIDPNNTIQNVKTHIYGKTGIPSTQQRLIYEGKILHVDATLSHYNIKNESMLLLLAAKNDYPIEAIQIFIKIIRGKITKIIALDVFPNDTFENIKTYVYCKTGIPLAQQRLIFRGVEINNQNHHTLNDWGIQSGSTVWLVLCAQRGTRTITIKSMDGVNIELNIELQDAIYTIKEMIYGKTGILPQQQRLIYNGKQLQYRDWDTLRDCGITQQNTLCLLKRGSTTKITIERMNGDTIKLDVAPNDTVQNVKEMIYGKTGISTTSQHLICKKSRLLDDYQFLYGDVLGTRIRLMVGTLFTFCIKLIDCDEVIVIDIASDDQMAVEVLKLLVEEQEGIPCQEQIYDGLKPSETVCCKDKCLVLLKLRFCESYLNYIDMNYMKIAEEKEKKLKEMFANNISNMDRVLSEAQKRIEIISSLSALRCIKANVLGRIEFEGHKYLEKFNSEIYKIKQHLMTDWTQQIVKCDAKEITLKIKKQKFAKGYYAKRCLNITNRKLSELDKKVSTMERIYHKRLQKAQHQEAFKETINRQIQELEKNVHLGDVDTVKGWILLIENGYFDHSKYIAFIKTIDKIGVNGKTLKELNSTLLLNIMGLKDKDHQYILRKHINRILQQQHAINDQSMCGLCIENAIDTVILPCGHQYHCNPCAQKYRDNKCPICRVGIHKIIRTYPSGFSK